MREGVGRDQPEVRHGVRLSSVDGSRLFRQACTLMGCALLFYAVQQRLWPAPFGVLVQGTVIGGLTALVAFGIALVYRANRVVNFAQGDLGGVPASLAVLLIVGPGVPFPIAMLAGLAAGVALGAFVEIVIVRRFFRAPRLILMVVTIGLAQVLAAVGILLPRGFDLRLPPQSYPSPLDFSFEIHPIVFRGNDILAMITVPVAIAALAVFLRSTSIGMAVRASAERADRASLLGVRVGRIHTIVWVIATVLATVAMLLRAGIVGLPIGTVLGPGILLRALAAAVIGRMERLPTIFAAAVALGIVEQAIVWDSGRSLIADPILFVVVVGALLLQRRGVLSRAAEAGVSSWSSVEEVHPVPDELASLPEVRWARRALLTAAGLLLVGLPLVLGPGRVNLAAGVLIFSIVGVSLVVLTGWAGQVSLGQVAFLGVGAAVAGALTSRAGWDLSLALLIGGLSGAVTAVVIGLPALRIRGLFLAVTTLAFALATSSYLLNPEFVHWLPEGRVPRPALFGRISLDSETRYYYLTVVGFVFAVWLARGLRASGPGRALVAVRDNERNLEAWGLSPTAVKLTAFAVSGFLAAFAGGLFVHHQQSLGISAFLPAEGLRVFTIVVIGGLGSLAGAILGSFYIQGSAWFRSSMPADIRPFVDFFSTGAGLLIILLALPGGLGSLLYRGRDRLLRLVAQRRGIAVPSLVADGRTADEAEAPPPTVLEGVAPSHPPVVHALAALGAGHAVRVAALRYWPVAFTVLGLLAILALVPAEGGSSAGATSAQRSPASPFGRSTAPGAPEAPMPADVDAGGAFEPAVVPLSATPGTTGSPTAPASDSGSTSEPSGSAPAASGATSALTVVASGWASADAGTAASDAGVPEGSLPVRRRLGQTARYSFVRVAGSAPTLVLREAGDAATGIFAQSAMVRACRIVEGGWATGGPQTLDEAPRYDCASAVGGERGADGRWRFELGLLGPPDAGHGFALVPDDGAPENFEIVLMPEGG